jgi:hypothetical protein
VDGSGTAATFPTLSLNPNVKPVVST